MQRRTFIKGTAAAIPASMALQMLGQRWVFAQSADFKNPVEVLNYALTLEYLEAEFYRQGNAANLVGGAEATLLETIQSDEETHVTALTDTIKQVGGKPVKAPKVDFGGAFKDQKAFLELAHVFENTGVQAYLGAAPALFEEKELLSAAAAIFGVEARHAAVLGDLLGLEAEGGIFMGSTETPKPKDEVLKAVMPFVKS
jgi:hypothetical protein